MDGRVGRPVGKIEMNLNNLAVSFCESKIFLCENDCNFSPVVLCYNCNSKLKIHTHITKYKLNAIIVIISLNTAKVQHQIVTDTYLPECHIRAHCTVGRRYDSL